jgi:hypothetical protein
MDDEDEGIDSDDEDNAMDIAGNTINNNFSNSTVLMDETSNLEHQIHKLSKEITKLYREIQ